MNYMKMRALDLCLALLLCLDLSLEVAPFSMLSFLDLGSCPTVKPQKDLNLHHFSGVWYIQAATPNPFVKEHCISAKYTWNGSLMRIEEEGLSSKGIEVRSRTVAEFHPKFSKTDSVLGIRRSGIPAVAPFIIYETDYESYACLYSCLEFLGFRGLFMWALTREPQFNHHLVNECTSTAEKLGIQKRMKLREANCPNWNASSDASSFEEATYGNRMLAFSVASSSWPANPVVFCIAASLTLLLWRSWDAPSTAPAMW